MGIKVRHVFAVLSEKRTALPSLMPCKHLDFSDKRSVYDKPLAENRTLNACVMEACGICDILNLVTFSPERLSGKVVFYFQGSQWTSDTQVVLSPFMLE